MTCCLARADEYEECEQQRILCASSPVMLRTWWYISRCLDVPAVEGCWTRESECMSDAWRQHSVVVTTNKLPDSKVA
jgi:hypothetical protein